MKKEDVKLAVKDLDKKKKEKNQEIVDDDLMSEGSATAFNETEEVRDGESEFDNTLHEK